MTSAATIVRMNERIHELMRWQEHGHDMLTGAVDKNVPMGSFFQGWISAVRSAISNAPNREPLTAEWLGLPTPCFTNDRKNFDPIEFQRAVEARVAWIATLIKEELGKKPRHGTTELKNSVDTTSDRPRIFIGSSAEGLKIAENIGLSLHHMTETTVWSSGIFGLGEGSLESLVRASRTFDFAALVLTADDMTTSRDVTTPSPRDNVLFELGLFMGRLGPRRTFIVYNSDEKPKLPSDLAGVTAATFKSRRGDNNVLAQVNPACTQMKTAIEKLGKLDSAID